MTVTVEMDNQSEEYIYSLTKTVKQDLLKKKKKGTPLSFKEAKQWEDFAKLLHIYLHGTNHKILDEEVKFNGEKVKLRHYIADTLIDFLEIAPKKDNNIRLLFDETNRLVNRSADRKKHRWEESKKGPSHTPNKNQLSSDLNYAVLCRVVFKGEDADELYDIITDVHNRRVGADYNTSLQDICFESDFSYRAFKALPGYIQEELIRNTKSKAKSASLLPISRFLKNETKITQFFVMAKVKEMEPIYHFWFSQAMDKVIYIDGNISEGLQELDFLRNCHELQFDNSMHRYMKPQNFYLKGDDINDVYNNFLRKLSVLMTENKKLYSKHIVILEDSAISLKNVVAYDMTSQIKVISTLNSKERSY